MTITTDTGAVEAPPSVLLVIDGQMPCDTAGCKVIFRRPVDLDSPFAAQARHQLQRIAAAQHGWKQTFAGLFICSDCAGGPLGLVVVEHPYWSTPPTVASRPPVMHGDNVSTVALPAIRVADVRTSSGRRPYDSPRGAA